MFKSTINFEELKLGPELGRGGFGVVHQGTWRHNDVAVKKLLMENISSESAQEFERESKIMAQLHSPNIVQFYGFCMSPYCLVMEYMPNGSLFNVLKSDKPLEWPLRFHIAVDVAKGVAFLHHEAILHRDIKSLNVLLDKTYQAKLTDFGLSKVKAETKSNTMVSKTSKDSVGTLAWMAPELFEGHKVVYTQKSDIYSLGVTLWELASRKIPFSDASNPNLIPFWVQKGEREDIPKDCPSALAELIQKCWVGAPDQRPDADNIVILLKNVIEQFDKLPTHRESKKEIKLNALLPSGPSYVDNVHSETLPESKSLPKPVLLSEKLENLNLSPQNPVPAKVNAQELSKFLRLVAEGEQDQAEAMLKANKDLVLVPGDVTDLSGRSFKNITGFQYAVWALDRHMWSMIEKYLDKETIRSQIEAMDRGDWVKSNNKSFNFQPLLDALDKQLELYKADKWDDAEKQWKVEVGGAQRQLPVHVVNEYCHPNRSFEKVPDFSAELVLPRTRQTIDGEWTHSYNSGRLGKTRAVCRGDRHMPMVWKGGQQWGGLRTTMQDRAACHALFETRMRERDALLQKYQAKNTLRN